MPTFAYAAERCVVGGFAYAGQTCISVQRILVEQSVYGKFTDLLVEAVKQLKTGDPLDESTDVGPLIRESRRDPHRRLDRRGRPRRCSIAVRRPPH